MLLHYHFEVRNKLGAWVVVASFAVQSDAERCYQILGDSDKRIVSRLVMVGAKDGKLVTLFEGKPRP